MMNKFFMRNPLRKINLHSFRTLFIFWRTETFFLRKRLWCMYISYLVWKQVGTPSFFNLRWYKFYLENRYADTFLHEVKVLKKVSKGVQQGSLLRPLIWSVYFEKWLSLQMGPVSPKAFCDDGIMLLTRHDQYSMVAIIRECVRTSAVFCQ